MTNKNAVSDAAYDAFVKESAGWNVDQSGLPSVQARQNRKTKGGDGMIDERFAPLASDRPLKLRRALTKFANDNSRDAEVAAVLRNVKDDADGHEGAVFFTIRATGQQLAVNVERTRDGWTAIADGQRYTAATRDDLLSAISKGLNDHARDLTAADLREVSQTCALQGYLYGIAKYCALKTGTSEQDILSDYDGYVLDARNARLVDESMSFCFLACSPEFSPGADWPSFLAYYANGRHYSWPLMQGAKAAYIEERQQARRDAILSPPAEPPAPEEPPTYTELDELGNGQLDELYRSTLKVHARAARH